MLATVRKANPYHDEKGRFTTGDNAYFISTAGVFDTPPDTPNRSMASAPETEGLVSRVMNAINQKLNKIPPPIPPPRGEDIHQPIAANSIDALYAQAKEASPLFDALLEKVGGALGSRKTHQINSPDDYKAAMSDLENGPDGIVTLIAGLKGPDRLKQKVHDDYNDNFSLVGDVVRGTFATDTLEELDQVVAALLENGATLARDPSNRYAKPTPSGYRDVMMNLKLPNGHAAELQINTKIMMAAKDVGHPLYEKERTITGRAKGEKRKLTKEERATVLDLQAQQTVIYGAAWERVLKKSGAK